MKNNRVTIGLTFLFVLLQSSLCFAQIPAVSDPSTVGMSGERLSRITERFQDYIDKGQLPGTVTLISRRGKVVYYEALGMSKVNDGQKMEKDAIFRIASQTKAVVSVAIMILQEEGKLLISDPVSKYIPAFESTTVAVPKDGGGYEVVPAARKIKIRDLLTHTSGIGYGYGPGISAWEEAGIQGWYFADRQEAIAETVNRLAKLPMNAQPGEKFVYGYSTDVLGVVIEKASGLPLDEFISQRITKPLGMIDTYFYLPKEKAERLAKVYDPTGGKLLESPVTGTMNAQGAYVDGPRKSFSGGAGLLSTAVDYYRFLQMLANGGQLDDVRLLSPKTVELMTANHLGEIVIPWERGAGFGLGFSIALDLGESGIPGSVGSYGWGGAYNSTYWIDPEEEIIAVYFSQVRPNSVVKDQEMLKNLVYQAIIE